MLPGLWYDPELTQNRKVFPMKRALAIIAFVALAGCGGSDPELTKAETESALTTLSTATGVGVSAALDVSVDSGQASVTATGNCLGGGTVAASGMVQASAESASYSLDLTYDACAVGGISMDGVLSYEGSASETSISFSMQGEVTFSGQIEGTCSIDIEMTIDSQTASFSAEGNACGNSFSGQLQIGN